MNSSKNQQLPTGTVIKAWREYRGMKATQLAETAGLSRPYVSILESNKIKHPSNEQLGKLALALKVPLIDLIRGQLPPQAEISGEHWVNSIHETNSEVHGHLREGAVGAQVERLIAHAGLSELEKQILAKQIIGLTENIVQLLTVTRQNQQSSQKFTHETRQTIS